jgi:hypothetical protein
MGDYVRSLSLAKHCIAPLSPVQSIA